MGCFSGMIRTIMFIFNFACLAVGIVLMAVGAVFFISLDEYDKLIEESSGFKVVPSLMIAVGVIIFVISFLGCCGAMKNSSCMLTTYAIILIILLIVQFVGGIYGVVTYTDDDEGFRYDVLKQLRTAFGKYDSNKVVKDTFQSIQSTLECCGVDAATDYTLILKWTPGLYAGGCCGKENEDTCSLLSPDIKVEGCGPKFFEALNAAVRIVSIVALAICGVELLGAIVAICLVRSK